MAGMRWAVTLLIAPKRTLGVSRRTPRALQCGRRRARRRMQGKRLVLACVFVCLSVCLARVAQLLKANRRVEEEKLADLKEKQKEAEVEKALWEERQVRRPLPPSSPPSLQPSLARSLARACRVLRARVRRGVGAW